MCAIIFLEKIRPPCRRHVHYHKHFFFCRLSSEPTVDLSRVTGNSSVLPSLQKCPSLAVAPTIENPSLSTSSSQSATLTSQAASNIMIAPASAERDHQEHLHRSRRVSSLNNTVQSVTISSEMKDPGPAFSPDLCVICLMQPRNASLVHGRTGHQVCCIGCAEKLKENKKKCPVCRKKIKLIVKNFF